MGGYVTQQRSVRDKNLVCSYLLNVTPYTGTLRLPNPQQTTYSYRSGVTDGNVLASLRPTTLLEMANSNRGFDTGHEFWSSKTVVGYSHRAAYLRNSSGSRYYRGPLFPDFSGGFLPVGWRDLLPVVPNTDANTMHLAGNTAIAATRPTRSVSSLIEAFADMRRGKGISFPTRTWNLYTRTLLNPFNLKDRTRAFRELGSDYLNVQFGWVPMVNDLVALLHAVVDSARIIEQYQRDSGRIVRRTFRFPQVTNISVSQEGPTIYVYNVANSSNWNSLFTGGLATGKYSFSGTQSEKTWFKGAYTYYIPEDINAFGKIAKYPRMLKSYLVSGLLRNAYGNLLHGPG